MTDNDTQGGPEWERDEAAELMGKAVQAGNADAIAEAAARLGDAVVNGTSARLIPTLERTLEVVLKKLIMPIAAQSDAIARVQADERLNTREQLESLWAHLDKRFDHRDHEFDTFQVEARAAWEGSAQQIKKLRESQAATDKQSREYYEENRGQIEALSERLDLYIAGSMRSEVSVIKQDIREVKERLERLERGGDESR